MLIVTAPEIPGKRYVMLRTVIELKQMQLYLCVLKPAPWWAMQVKF